MNSRHTKFLLLGLAVCVALIVLMFFIPGQSVLDEIRDEGKLIVLTRNAPTTYYFDRNGENGYEYYLAHSIAQALGVDVEFKIYDTITEILTAIKNGEGHIAAASLTRTKDREIEYLFGPDYKSIRQQLVCHRKGPYPKTVNGLASVSIQVIANSSYAERLTELQIEIPDLKWEATTEHSTEQLLERVSKREIDCTVADSTVVALNRRYFPELIVPFDLTETQHLAWVLKPAAKQLAAFLEEQFETTQMLGLLENLNERFYGHVKIFDYVDLIKFKKRIQSRLPKYQEYFETAASEHDLQWTFLAAQAYQESHWSAKARSPTGVRGIMMLTKVTAAEVGIKSRLNPQQSILGGAKYFAKIFRKIPAEVQGLDRLWFALAAYNVGFGHLKDARILAQRLGKNPNTWVGIKVVMPLLAQKKYYKTLKYGYARGTEPIRYVQRIRHYQQILVHHMS